MKKSNIRKTKFNARAFAGNFFLYLFLIVLAIICFTPFYIMIINATRSTQAINAGISLIPGKALVENYKSMMASMNIWKGFLNSLIIAISSTLLSAYFGALTAYAFSKFRFKGNKALFWFILGTMMIPPQLGLIGYYILTARLHIINTYWALILPAVANASTVFFLKMYIDTNVNESLLEAARVDGSSEIYTFNRIVFPIILPGVATMSILNFIASWNNYLTPLVLLFDKDKFTLPILIALVKGTYKQNLGAQYMAVAISIVPIIIAFTFLSKYIISGITAGALKE
ncbi:MAG: carbohydrate ABC transporter permease [Actinomycetota bacterium]|jgi:multiple sugar transport system permease protein|nr:carbohydrate ABC transporter permease [Actinomycetota bacterium]